MGINRVNRWVLGFPELSSAELAKRYADHIAQTPASICFNSQLSAIDALPDGYRLRLSDNEQNQTLRVRALVIATGVRSLGAELFSDLPGFADVRDSGLISFFPIDHLDKLTALKNRLVAVIGGGDNAYFTAKDAALAGAHVHLIQRSPPKAQLSVRAEVSALASQGRITEYENTVAAAFRLGQQGMELLLKPHEKPGSWLSVDTVFVRIGFAANSEFLAAFTAFSELHKQNGYICTDVHKRTNLPWVYAIGDIANPKHQSVVGALADGALAAQDFSGRRT